MKKPVADWTKADDVGINIKAVLELLSKIASSN